MILYLNREDPRLYAMISTTKIEFQHDTNDLLNDHGKPDESQARKHTARGP